MSTGELFSGSAEALPLAAALRPQHLDDVVGQVHLLGEEGALRRLLRAGQLPSMLLWGPPGVGKTTIARLLAHEVGAELIEMSAVAAGVREVRDEIAAARRRRQQGRRTLLFIDEIHRFNKAQQDALLPHVEDGTVTLIGATTENPSFEVNRALLSRLKVFRLEALADAALTQLLARAVNAIPGAKLPQPAVQAAMLAASDGDGRRLLNLVEQAYASASDGDVTPLDVERALMAGPRHFDKRGDAFYDQISALHKSVRGSSPDAGLYWLARMLDGGCDPLYIARRLVRMATEDVGAAEPAALRWCLDAWDAVERLGSPEADLALARAVVLLAAAPKSNALYAALAAARADVEQFGSVAVPLHIRNAPTSLMKAFGHGHDYRYAHDADDAFVAGESYVPEALASHIYYHPTPRGHEARIAERLREWRQRHAASAWQRWPAP